MEGISRQLVCAEQTAVDTDGNPQHPGNMRNQLAVALDNLAAVLTAAGMGLANITRLNVCTTDVDEALKHFDVLGARMGRVARHPP